MPKITRCITDVKLQEAHCINSFGTEFDLKFTDRGTGTPDDMGFDKQFCVPGRQAIDMAAWWREMLATLSKGIQ